MIKKITILFLLTITALLATACGLLREPQEASGAIEAIPLELETQAPAPEADPATAAAYPSPAQSVAQPTTAYPEAQEEVADTTTNDTTGDADAGLRIYQISPAGSQVTFELDEDLRGQRTTVVGRTDQVAGELALDLADLSTAQLGVIQINARTLLTDNDFRNRAIHNEILDTGAYEFITFTPTGIAGLPPSAAVGQEVTFTVHGDLTIRDVTQPVSFDVVAVALSETELSGRATTTIERQAFALTIPQVRQVANVEEEVTLTINFIARTT